jgi:GMP synthase-like glutamine amidotransferase
MTLRLSILNANTDRSAFSQRWPDDGHKVIKGLAPLRPNWQFRVFEACAGELPEPGTDDAWVITGSVASVNDEAHWMQELEARLRQRDAQRQATVGLCFGHQIMAKALGGTVGPSPGGWRLGVASTRYAASQLWMSPARAEISLFAVHQEQVLRPPVQAMVLGGDSFTPAGALQVGLHMMSTQYHPELTREFMRDLLATFADEWEPELVAQARQQVEQAVDASLFMSWVANFVEQAQKGRA